ncbi:MAG: FAD-dependent oxidoreductase, partial [bacterium]
MSEKSHIVLRVEGMTCDGCARHVTEALKSAAGTEEAQVGSWKSGQATVIADETVKDEDLVKAVKKAGYRTIVLEHKRVEGQRKAPPTDGVEYDLMIIGAGGAAFAAAIKASELGSKVAMIESGTIGGTCVNIGCVPSKTLICAAENCYKCSYQGFKGMAVCPPPEDWQRVIKQKDQIVTDLREGKYVNVAKSYPDITIIKGTAELTGKRLLSVDGKTYQPGKILIATGSRPWAPPIPGLREAGFIDSTEALSTLGHKFGDVFSSNHFL